MLAFPERKKHKPPAAKTSKMSEYERSLVAVDPVIFTISDSTLKVLLTRREKDPFKGFYELPGGLLQAKETSDETLARKLKEVLGIKGLFMTQFHTFTDPKRDPRSRTVSIGYIALIGKHQVPISEGWFALSALPALAFDHKEIIVRAHEYLKKNLDSQIVAHFLPSRFPLNSLQLIHEVVTGQRFDNRNFRRKMVVSGVVVQTKERQEGVSHRPANLFKFN